MINLQDYVSTGRETQILTQLGVKYLKSTEGYKLINHLNKQNGTWLIGSVIKDNNLILPSNNQTIQLEPINKGQVINHSNQYIHQTISNININMKNTSVMEYFEKKVGYQKDQKKQKNKDQRQKASRVVEKMTPQQKARKKRIRQRLLFLKKRRAKIIENTKNNQEQKLKINE